MEITRRPIADNVRSYGAISNSSARNAIMVQSCDLPKKRVEEMLKFITGLIAGLLFCVSAFGQTADECIQQYEALKPEFEKLSAATPVDCVQEGHIISLDREGNDQDLPASCVGVERQVDDAWVEGVESHWHLRAQAVLGPSPSCSVRLLGFTGEALELHPECGTGEFHIDLPADEGAKWRNYLRDECGK